MRHTANRNGIFDAGALRRIAVAIVLSVAAHAAAIWAIRAGPPNVAAGAKTIEARIVPVIERTEPETSLVTPTQVSSAAKEPDRSEPVAPLARAAELAPAAETRPEAARTTEPSARAPVHPAGQAQDVPLASDPVYHPITALDRPPAPLTAADVCFPSGASGELTYELLIDEAGVVNDANVLAAHPRGLPTARAMERCRALKFSPAIKDGRAVKSKVRLVVGTQ